MKILHALLVLTPVFAVVAMLAGILGSDRGFEVCGLGFLVALFASFFCALYLLNREATKKFGTPVGWSDAQTLYPLPETIEGSRIRGRQFIKDNVRVKLFFCRLRVDKNGVLIEPTPHPSGLRQFSVGEIYITWGALQDAKETALPWYVSLGRQVGIESAIQGTQLSLVVTMDAWTRHFAPHITGK